MNDSRNLFVWLLLMLLLMGGLQVLESIMVIPPVRWCAECSYQTIPLIFLVSVEPEVLVIYVFCCFRTKISRSAPASLWQLWGCQCWFIQAEENGQTSMDYRIWLPAALLLHQCHWHRDQGNFWLYEVWKACSESWPSKSHYKLALSELLFCTWEACPRNSQQLFTILCIRTSLTTTKYRVSQIMALPTPHQRL